MSWGLPATASSPPDGSDLGDLGHPRPDLTADELAGFAEGQRLFTQKPPGIGPLFNDQACSDCHSVPTLGGSGTLEHVAIKGDEFRTTPLWGLRFKKLFLHDGRVSTIVDAVTAHGGEASAAVTAYRNASSEQREALLRFLRTL